MKQKSKRILQPLAATTSSSTGALRRESLGSSVGMELRPIRAGSGEVAIDAAVKRKKAANAEPKVMDVGEEKKEREDVEVGCATKEEPPAVAAKPFEEMLEEMAAA